MRDLNDAVERLEPMPDEPGDWHAVARDARRRRPVLLGSVAGVAVAAAALFALVLFEPWATERRTFLERALAAVDDGPVIHAVLRGDWGGTDVDLTTGARTPVHGENEIWYDRQRGLIRTVSRLGETVIHDSVYEKDASPELVALARDYKAALESGSARTTGQDVIDGQPVTWVVVEARRLPHGDGKLREWTQQVAVSNETFKPVATQDFVDDGKAGRGSLQRVLEVEALPAAAVEFASPSSGVEGPFTGGEDPITREAVADVLGRAGVWLGEEHSGLRLARVSETFVRQGKQSERALTGPEAEDAKECAGAMRRGERLESEACLRMRDRRHGFSIRGDTVYQHGPVVWGEKERGVSFFYGTLGDDPSTYRMPRVPVRSEPYVKLSITTEIPKMVVGGAYFPDEGTLFIAAGNRQGNLSYDGLYVVIQGSSPELILSAARALEPMPR
jgi:hypothetical protein